MNVLLCLEVLTLLWMGNYVCNQLFIKIPGQVLNYPNQPLH